MKSSQAATGMGDSYSGELGIFQLPQLTRYREGSGEKTVCEIVHGVGV